MLGSGSVFGGFTTGFESSPDDIASPILSLPLTLTIAVAVISRTSPIFESSSYAFLATSQTLKPLYDDSANFREVPPRHAIFLCIGSFPVVALNNDTGTNLLPNVLLESGGFTLELTTLAQVGLCSLWILLLVVSISSFNYEK
ncbi:hypothetical protein AYI69_g10596 [Smittium culicis]|uniref:Uncharacterized protein n=1 Tax=Smittium culicis TaxID=133412 RepID=A0A1R1X4M1_9FUNG|nr:hypothetical protein AYI69_g10596 [Smittium culicis]